jgi:hypothetical protein
MPIDAAWDTGLPHRRRRMRSMGEAQMDDGAPHAVPTPVQRLLPIEVRTALHGIAAPGSEVRPQYDCVVGQPALVRYLKECTPRAQPGSRLIALGAAPDELRAAVAALRPAAVTVVADGMLAGVFRPLRADAYALGRDLSPRHWHALGYEPVRTSGVQGVAAVFWVTCERLARRIGRPALADRCRVAMLQSLPTAPVARNVAAIVVREYRSVR